MTRARDKASAVVANFASTGIDDNADANAITIDSIGQAGLSGSSNSFDTTGSVNGLQLYYESDAGLATIGSYSGGGSTNLSFHTNSGGSASTERFRITANGVTFNGDTAAANALDDYEEGTWTATLERTTTNPTFSSIGNTTGHYVKIGNMVHVTYYTSAIAFTNGGSGTSQISGLPFTAANGTEEYWLFQYLHGDAIVETTTGGYINKNTNRMTFVVQGSTGGAAYQSSGTRYIMVSASYRAA